MNKISPPPLARKLLIKFLRNDLAEEVQGDLEEKFYSDLKYKSSWKAKLQYWYQVINYLRPFAIRNSIPTNSNNYDMFRNYFTIGWRNLTRTKGYSIINIGGLAIGITVTMLISLWIYDELTFNHYHKNYNRLAQVMQNQTLNGNTATEYSIPRPLENALRTGYGNDFEYLSMASWTHDHILNVGENAITKSGNFFQADFPEMISLEMIEGTRQGLKDPTSILLSESTAVALFGNTDPMNKIVRIGNQLDVKVTGIYKDIPYSSSFKKLDFIASWELFLTTESWLKGALEQWGNNSFQMFALISPHANMKLVSEKIKKSKYDRSKREQEYKPEIFLHAMTDWHLKSNWKGGANVGGRIQMVWLFGIIGAFVLLLACINFMNLSTARSEKRAKEVGIRMTIGSLRRQLVNQFLCESFLVVLLAFVAAIVLVMLALPWFNHLSDKRIVVEWTNPIFWTISFVFILFTSLVAGSYPALYLSSFNPVKVLKGTFKVGRFASLPRKVLVVVQFAVSLTLIIGTTIVHQQIQFSKSRPVGYDREGLVMMQKRSPEFNGKYNLLRTELKNSGAIEEMSESSGPVTRVNSNNGGFTWPGKDPNLQEEFATIWISHEYGRTINWKIVSGRDLSREFLTDSTGMILNETAVKYMGLKDPIGTEVTSGDEKYRIVGVVKDIVMESPYSPIKPTLYISYSQSLNWITLKLSSSKSASESLSTIKSVFKKHVPSAPFDYKFVDEEYAKKFNDEERVGKLATVFSVLAIVISCLGLFGLASFVAEQRTKEIGIRKVLGASVPNLWKLLSMDFVLLILVACVISIPIAYYVLSNWLLGYDYHTEISWWIFIVSGAGAVIITLSTVSFQAIRAALMSPVKSLKSE